MAHGTLGIVYALVSVGEAAGRQDMIEMALAGAADVVSRNEADPDGFLVPHSDPPELIERYSYGWCNGPAGDAQVFHLLARITSDQAWTALGDRCWQTVRESGLPRRIRPGFWDNNARCCGTAGVLALACDRIIERGDDFDFANMLVDDLTAEPVPEAEPGSGADPGASQCIPGAGATMPARLSGALPAPAPAPRPHAPAPPACPGRNRATPSGRAPDGTAGHRR
jgi:hypothetical protein